MDFLKPFSQFNSGDTWEFLQIAYLLIQPISMMATFLRSTPKKTAKKDNRKLQKRFISRLEEACKTAALSHGEQLFLPEGMVSTLVTSDEVTKLIPGADHDLLVFICNDAKKLFLNTLLCRHERVYDAMRSFYEYQVTDDKLPVKTPVLCDPSPEGECSHKTKWPCLKFWACCEISLFQKCQWVFFAPVFNENNSLLELHDSQVLPFTWVDEIGTGGHFSTVCKATIHPDHYQGYTSSYKACCERNKAHRSQG